LEGVARKWQRKGLKRLNPRPKMVWLGSRGPTRSGTRARLTMHDSGRAARKTKLLGTMLQKKAPSDLKSLDAELKSAHALRGAAGRARPAQGYGPSLRFCKVGRFHGRAFQGLHSAQAPAVVSAPALRRVARRRAGAAKLGPADRPTIGGAYRGRAECPVPRQRAKRIGRATRRKLFLAARP